MSTQQQLDEVSRRLQEEKGLDDQQICTMLVCGGLPRLEAALRDEAIVPSKESIRREIEALRSLD